MNYALWFLGNGYRTGKLDGRQTETQAERETSATTGFAGQRRVPTVPVSRSAVRRRCPHEKDVGRGGTLGLRTGLQLFFQPDAGRPDIHVVR